MARSSVELIVDATKAINPLRKTQQETKKLEKATRDLNGRLRDSRGRFIATGNAAKSASAGVNKLSGAIKGLITVAAVFEGLKFTILKTAELEKQQKSLQVLTGSLEKANAIIKELQAFGAVTPFTSSELIQTAKRLRAFGISTEKLVDTTKRLADVAGATGADLAGIATAFGQIQAKGRLQTEELLQLQERGVDLAGVLKKEYNLTGVEFSKALQKGQVSAEAAEFALQKLTDTGGQYADGAIAQSDTLAGKFSTLIDGVEQLAKKLGERLTPVLKTILDLANNTLFQINNLITSITNPGKSLRENIKAGILPFNVQGADDLFRGTGPRGRGAQGMREQAKELSALRGQPFRDVLLELYQNRLKTMEGVTNASSQPLARNAPALGGGNGKDRGTNGSGTGRSAQIKKRLDMSQEMFALEQKRQSLEFTNNEIAKIELDRQIAVQRILESTLGTREKTIGIQDAQNNAIRQTQRLLEPVVEGVADIQQGAIDAGKAFAQMAIDADNERLAANAEKLKQVYMSIGDTVTDGIVDAITSAVDGTKTLGEVASSVLQDIGNTLLRFGLNTLFDSLSGGSGGLGGLLSGLLGGLHTGGPAQKGSAYVVGERGPELFVPNQSGQVVNNDQMKAAMGRYKRSAGASGGFTSGGATESDGGGFGANSSIDVRYTVERINSVDYVTADQFQQGLQQAARQGAAEGERRTMRSLQNSTAVRRRLSV